MLHVHATPPAVIDALDDAGLPYKEKEFICNHRVTTSLFEVDVFGSRIMLSSQIALVEPEQRAALITKKAA